MKLWPPLVASRCSVVLLCLGTPCAAQTASSAGTPQAESTCTVATDAAYAYTPEQAVQVGGGAMFVASRERRYLDALRGPAGEPLQYRRVSSLESPDGQSTLDKYEVTYAGAEQPVALYLDAYHFDDRLLAPKGFTCATAIVLDPPGPDLFQASRHLVRLAVEHGAQRDISPIPLDSASSDGNTAPRGVVLDHYRMMARAARAAALEGKPIVLDPSVRPPDSLRLRTVVIAYPLACGGRQIAPQAVDLISSQGQHAPRHGANVSGEALAQLVANLPVPEGSLAATFGVQAPRENDSVRITYAEACQGTTEVIMPLRYAPVRLVNTPEAPMPEGSALASGSVRLQVQVDLEGRLAYPTYVGGPRQLVQPAIQALRDWNVEPARMNGVPVSTPLVVQVRFRQREGL
jgi:hypothetical protein